MVKINERDMSKIQLACIKDAREELKGLVIEVYIPAIVSPLQ
jgi:hypothetical protein